MRVECPGRFTLLNQGPRRRFEEGRDDMGIVGCYCKYAEYAVADGRQGVLLHVGVSVSIYFIVLTTMYIGYIHFLYLVFLVSVEVCDVSL